MDSKICSKCDIERPSSYFNKRSRSKDGLRSDCSLCREKIAKKYREDNQEKIKESNVKWVKNNPLKAKEVSCKSTKKYRKK